MSINIINENKINKNYIKYYLLLNQLNIYNNYTVHNAQARMETNKLLREFKIPNLTDTHQKEIVKFLDEIYENAKIEDTIKYLKDKPIFNLLINKNYEDYKNIIFYQDNIKQLLFELSNIPKKKNLQIKSIFNSYQNVCEIKKLGDIINFKCGTKVNLQTYLTNKSNYGIIRSRNINKNNNDFLYVTEEGYKLCKNSLVNENDIVMTSFVDAFDVQIVPNKWNNFTFNGGVFKLYNLSKTISIKYFIKYIKSLDFINKIKTIRSGSVGMFSIEGLKQLTIHVPSLEIQEEIIKQIELLEEPLSHYNQYAQMLETELNNINEIINTMTLLNTPDIINNEENTIEYNIIEDEEIEYKGKIYFLNNDNVYIKLDDGTKGPIYGIYKNGKVKKIKITEITI